jgi:hypothetical protein
VPTSGEGDCDAVTGMMLGMFSSETGVKETGTGTKGTPLDGDTIGNVIVGSTVRGNDAKGGLDTGRLLLFGVRTGATVIINPVGFNVPSINIGGNPIVGSSIGLGAGFSVFEVPGGSMLIELLLGSTDVLLSFGASDGGTTTTLVGLGDGSGAASTVTVFTISPEVSYVVLTTCPHSFWGSSNIEQNGTATSKDTTHCIRSSNVPVLHPFFVVFSTVVESSVSNVRLFCDGCWRSCFTTIEFKVVFLNNDKYRDSLFDSSFS